MTNREIVEQAYKTELSNMVWKPFYPNNILGIQIKKVK